MKALLREVESFWTLFTAPAIWVGHFLACYVSAAIFCAKPDFFGLSFGGLRATIAVLTLVALAGIVLSAWLAWRQWSFGSDDPPHDDPSRHDRSLFQGFATLLLSALSFVAVIFTALPAVFIADCVR